MSAPKPDPRSGLDAEGNWTPAFPGQRPPFEAGHELGGRPVEHGAYAVLHLTPRAGEIAEWIRGLGDHLTPADEPALQTLALMLAQLERAAGVLVEVDGAIVRGRDVDAYLARIERRARLSSDARGWAKEARNLMHELGLTPAGRVALEERQLTVIHVAEVQVALSEWARVTGEFVAPARRADFLEAIARLAIEMPVPAIELPPASDVVAAPP